MDQYLHADIIECIHRYHHNTLYSEVIHEYKDRVAFVYLYNGGRIYYSINEIENFGNVSLYGDISITFERAEPEEPIYRRPKGVPRRMSNYIFSDNLGHIVASFIYNFISAKSPCYEYTYPTQDDLNRVLGDIYVKEN